MVTHIRVAPENALCLLPAVTAPTYEHTHNIRCSIMMAVQKNVSYPIIAVIGYQIIQGHIADISGQPILIRDFQSIPVFVLYPYGIYSIFLCHRGNIIILCIIGRFGALSDPHIIDPVPRPITVGFVGRERIVMHGVDVDRITYEL